MCAKIPALDVSGGFATDSVRSRFHPFAFLFFIFVLLEEKLFAEETDEQGIRKMCVRNTAKLKKEFRFPNTLLVIEVVSIQRII